MRTATVYNGLRQLAPEPRAPMPATETSRAAREVKELPQKEENLNPAVLSSKFQTSHHKSKANCEFFHTYIITGFQQERLFKHPEKIKLVSHQRGEQQTEPPNNFALRPDGSTHNCFICSSAVQPVNKE